MACNRNFQKAKATAIYYIRSRFYVRKFDSRETKIFPRFSLTQNIRLNILSLPNSHVIENILWRKKMKKILTLSMFIILSFMVLSCATTVQRVPLSKDATVKVTGKTCEISRYEKPAFYAQTTGKAWLPPMIGMSSSFSAGKEIVAKNNIEDPANYISQEMAKTLSEIFDVKLLSTSEAISENDSIDTLCKTYNKGDLLLDIRTMGWAFGTGSAFAAFSTSYQVSIVVHLRIIDIKAKEVLAEEIFIYPSKASDNINKALSYDDLMSNNAEGLKKELRKEADEAILFFKQKALNL
jgi:hypothetical protein